MAGKQKIKTIRTSDPIKVSCVGRVVEFIRFIPDCFRILKKIIVPKDEAEPLKPDQPRGKKRT